MENEVLKEDLDERIEEEIEEVLEDKRTEKEIIDSVIKVIETHLKNACSRNIVCSHFSNFYGEPPGTSRRCLLYEIFLSRILKQEKEEKRYGPDYPRELIDMLRRREICPHYGIGIGECQVKGRPYLHKEDSSDKKDDGTDQLSFLSVLFQSMDSD